MTDRERSEEDEVMLPEDAVEDLEPQPEEGDQVSGGWRKIIIDGK
jgi:hypothetical protein